MSTVHLDPFATLGLVGQTPGGPDEDPEGTPSGGWQAPLFDPIAGEHAAGPPVTSAAGAVLPRYRPAPGRPRPAT